jgi:hypothetical protein
MRTKYLAWMFVPAMVLGLAACDNTGQQGAGTSRSTTGSGTDTTKASPMGGPSGSSAGTESQSSSAGGSSGQQSATTPPPSGSSSSG